MLSVSLIASMNWGCDQSSDSLSRMSSRACRAARVHASFLANDGKTTERFEKIGFCANARRMAFRRWNFSSPQRNTVNGRSVGSVGTFLPLTVAIMDDDADEFQSASGWPESGDVGKRIWLLFSDQFKYTLPMIQILVVCTQLYIMSCNVSVDVGLSTKPLELAAWNLPDIPKGAGAEPCVHAHIPQPRTR